MGRTSRIKHLWHGFLNYVARRSPAYKKLKEGVITRELGLEIREIELELKELREERDLHQANYESASEYADSMEVMVQDARTMASHERALRRHAEELMEQALRENADLKERIAESLPIGVVDYFVQRTPSPLLYANPDHVIISSNEKAAEAFSGRGPLKRRDLFGLLDKKGVDELLRLEKMRPVRDEKGTHYHQFQEGRLKGWYFVPLVFSEKEGGGNYGYFLSHGPANWIEKKLKELASLMKSVYPSREIIIAREVPEWISIDIGSGE